MGRGPHVRFLACVAGLAGGLAWLATSPRWLVHINWDAGSYLHQLAMGKLSWSSPPWTAHAALQYLYLLFRAVAQLLHRSTADGFRLLNAVCFAFSTVVMVHAATRLARSRVLGLLIASLWATAFVTQFLIFTLEDNIVFLAPAVLLCGLCATRCQRWGGRESFVAGLLASSALLLSIQGVLYLLLPLGLAACAPRASNVAMRRLRDLSLVLAGFAVGLFCFAVLLWLSSSLGWKGTVAHLLARPTSTFPQSKAALLAQIFDLPASLRTIGIAASLHLFQNHRPVTSSVGLACLGAAVILIELTLVVVTSRRVRAGRHIGAFFFACALLTMTVLTSLYRDVEFAYLKRTDFAPLLLAFLIMSLLTTARLSIGKRRTLAVIFGMLGAWQLVAGLGWRAREASSYESLDLSVLRRPVPGYHGLPSGGSFLHHMRALAAAHPGACRFVFDFAEVNHGRWNPDLTGVIWSELPSHAVLVSPQTMKTWPRPLEAWNPSEAKRRLTGCEWISQAARKRLGLAAAP